VTRQQIGGQFTPGTVNHSSEITGRLVGKPSLGIELPVSRQAVTVRKDNNLDRIERPLQTRYTCFTCEKHGEPPQPGDPTSHGHFYMDFLEGVGNDVTEVDQS